MMELNQLKNIALPIDVGPEAHAWAKQILDGLSFKEKIGQLIHVAAWSDKPKAHQKQIQELIDEYSIGGLIFFQGNALNQALLTKQYQASSKIPLMIAIDGEWGLGMRLSNVEAFPYQMTLGAIQDTQLIYEMGRSVAKQMKMLGIHLNYAPVIDVNTNPKNPVINFRSFGEEADSVASRGVAYMKGMQDEQLLACAKHFPGHGDTSSDSHVELPRLNKTKSELEQTELRPFKKLFDEGLGAVMTAHLQIPSLEPDPKTASTLSSQIVTGLLKEDMGFEGLVITDAMDMKAIVDHHDPGHAEVKALSAGNDILLFVNDVAKTIYQISAAVHQGVISIEEIDRKCYKQLLYKHWAGLSSDRTLSTEGLLERINRETSSINEKLYAASITRLKQGHGLPSQPDRLAIVSLFASGDHVEDGELSHHTLLKSALGQMDGVPLFEQMLMTHYHKEPPQYTLRYNDIEKQQDHVMSHIDTDQEVVLAVHDLKLKATDHFGMTEEIVAFIQKMASGHKVHLVFFGNPYAMVNLVRPELLASAILAYQENNYTCKYAFEVLTSQCDSPGRLPVSINQFWPCGHGS